MTDDLDLLITSMAREAAHHCSLAAATRQIRDLVAEARAEYHAAGGLTATTIAASVAGSSAARA